jgi:hypothetical protein
VGGVAATAVGADVRIDVPPATGAQLVHVFALTR